MRLDAILHKTKTKGNKEKVNREPPSIAEEERPYDLVSSSKMSLDLDNKVATNRQQSGNRSGNKPP
jgi:hypothetical protein